MEFDVPFFVAILICIFIAFILPVGVMWVYEGIIKWNRVWGEEVFYSTALKFRFRRKGVKISFFNFKQIEDAIINRLNQKPEFKDMDIMNNLQCVLTTNLFSTYGIKGIGSAIMVPYFWWKNCSYVYIICMDANLIHERNLNSQAIAGLFLHEYFHHYLEKYTGDCDWGHNSIYWDVFKK